MEDDLAIPYGAELSDLLVLVWRLLARGRDDEARSRLMALWSWGLDGLSTRKEGRVALGLFTRLGFSTDDEERWAALPDPLTIWRAGRVGLGWTVDRDVAEHHLAQMGKGARIRTGTVAKADALAFITNYGESEVILSPALARRLSRTRRR